MKHPFLWKISGFSSRFLLLWPARADGCVAAIWSADNEDFHMLTGLRPAICSQRCSSVRQHAVKAEASNAVAHLRTCSLTASTSACVCLTWSSESKQDTSCRKAGFTCPSLGDLRDRSAAADSVGTQINTLAWCFTCTTANTLSGLPDRWICRKNK